MEESEVKQGEIKADTLSSRAKLTLHRKLVFGYSIAGLIVGYASFLINAPLYALALMIAVGIAATQAFKKLFKPAEIGGKRWWSTGVVVYALVWFVVWTILFNIYTVKP